MITRNNPSRKPCLSFIVPFYASHEKLDECVQSLVCRCDVPFEILILDDGNSTYDYASVEREPSVQIIRNDRNEGPSHRRNQGIKLAQGTYVQFVDSDDMLVGAASAYFDAITEADAAAENPDVITGVLEGGRLFKRAAANLPRITSLEREPILAKLSGFTAHLYRRDFLLENKIEFPPDLRGAEDTVFLMRVLAKAKSVLLTETAHYRYRPVDNSLSKPPTQSDSPSAGGNAFELRFQVAAGYMLDALEAHPAAQTIRGSIVFKYGLKGLQRRAAYADKKPFDDALPVLARLIARINLIGYDADRLRAESGVYWDDHLQQIAEDIQDGDAAAVRAAVVSTDLRLF